MKIALFHNLPPGGAKRTVLEEVKELSKRHEIDLFQLFTTSEKLVDIRPYVKNVYRYKCLDKKFSSSFITRALKDFSDFVLLKRIHKRIASKINKEGYNVALIHADVNTQAPYVLRYLNIPTLYYCQEYLRMVYEKELKFDKEVSFIKKWYEKVTRVIRKNIDRKNAKSATVVLTNSQFSKRKIDKAYSINSIKCYLGVDTNVFKPRKVSKNFSLLFVGQPTKTKGYDFLIKSLDCLPSQIRPEVFVVNNYSKKKKLSDVELSKLYSSSLATICTSINEPFGLSALESMSCGTPVIAVNEGGFKETVVDNKTGFLVKRKTQDLAKSIKKILRKSKDFSSMCTAAKIRAKEFKWKYHSNIVEKTLKEIGRKRFLISGLDSGGWGGAENFMYYFSRAILKLEESAYFATVINSRFDRYLEKEKVKTAKVPFRMDILGHWKGFVKFFFLFPLGIIHRYLLLKRFKNQGGEIVIIPGFTDKILLSWISSLLNLKVIWVEYAPVDRILRRNLGMPLFLYKLVSKNANIIIVPTNYTKNNLLANRFFSEEKIHVVPCGIKVLPESEIARLKNKANVIKRQLRIQNKKIIGIVSRIEKGKGQEHLIKAVSLLKDKLDNFIVLIVGEGDARNLKKLIADLELQEYVKLIGFKKNIYEIMSTFDIFVFPTTWILEGFGIVSLEAMMLEIPLIVSNHGPVPEVVGNSALVVDVQPEKLAKSINLLLSDKLLQKKLAQNGKIRLVNKYNIENIAKEYLKVIDNI